MVFLFSDVNKIQEGIGDKIGNFFQWFCCFLAGMVIGFIYGWKLTLVILAFAPLLAISGGWMTMVRVPIVAHQFYLKLFLLITYCSLTPILCTCAVVSCQNLHMSISAYFFFKIKIIITEGTVKHDILATGKYSELVAIWLIACRIK